MTLRKSTLSSDKVGNAGSQGNYIAKISQIGYESMLTYYEKV